MKRILLSFIAVFLFAGGADAQIGAAVSANASNDNFLTETISADYTIAGDMFGIRSVGNPGTPGLPFSIADESGNNLDDFQGIINTNSDFGRFFGAVDTVNGIGSDTGTATWTFDVSGFAGLSVDIDFAAMGDFEVSDVHIFTWSIDGGPATWLFANSVDTDGSTTYTLADGTMIELNDPMAINGTLLSNAFQTLSASISGTGSTLTIAYSGTTDAGSEAFAFRNIVISSIPTPGAVALFGVAGLAGIRCRR